MVEAHGDSVFVDADDHSAFFDVDTLRGQIAQFDFLPLLKPSPGIDKSPSAAFIGDPAFIAPSPDSEFDWSGYFQPDVISLAPIAHDPNASLFSKAYLIPRFGV